jgi:CRP-like cAMP-binding protein/CheY-like chemotaxis protein
MRRVFRTLLEGMGHAPGDIQEAGDAIEAIACLKASKYACDYIIADYDMAGMENHAFLDRLKRDCPQRTIPVLLCIGATQRVAASEYLRHGATMILERPFRDGEARQKLQTIENGLLGKKPPEASPYVRTVVSNVEAEADLPFLMQLPSHLMKEFLQLSSRQTHQPGAIIYRAGDRVDCLYVVTLGDVEMIPENGRPSEISREGEAFGELAFMSGEPSPLTARAHSLTQVIALPRQKLTELVSHQPRMSQYLSALVARRSKVLNKAAPGVNTEFCGNLTSMSFADVLQLLQVGRKTGYLELERGGRKGWIGLDAGEVRSAKADTLESEEAFYELASWKGASFGFRTAALTGPSNIKTATMPLLMEAMRRVDEHSRSGTTEPAAADPGLKGLF